MVILNIVMFRNALGKRDLQKKYHIWKDVLKLLVTRFSNW